MNYLIRFQIKLAIPKYVARLTLFQFPCEEKRIISHFKVNINEFVLKVNYPNWCTFKR